MSMLTTALAALLRYLGLRLPPERQEWVEAIHAEADDVPPGGPRLRWVLGGLGLFAREAHLVRGLLTLAVGAIAAGEMLRYGWRAVPSDPGRGLDRIHLITMVVILFALPWIVRGRRIFGPVAAGVPARVVRAVGYAAVCALLPISIRLGHFTDARFETRDFASAADRLQWQHEAISRAIGGFVVLTTLFTGYAVAVLWLTSRRAALGSAVLTVGAGFGVLVGVGAYALMPFGGFVIRRPGWLATIAAIGLLVLTIGGPMLAGYLVIRLATGRELSGRAGSRAAAQPGTDPAGNPVRPAMLAGLVCGVTAGLLLTVLTLPTLLAFPHRVTLEWANPDPNVPHGTPFEVEMSVGDTAGRYESVLLLAPLMGLFLGACGAGLRGTVIEDVVGSQVGRGRVDPVSGEGVNG